MLQLTEEVLRLHRVKKNVTVYNAAHRKYAQNTES